MAAYYNEHDPKAAAWLRELIKQGHIAPGDVDERSIEDVLPSDLNGYTQCHFFAGIGVWSYALRQAGWPDDRPVWTGSCPCQPFSAAGKSGGFDDERHLWPAFHHLISQCRPNVVFGEQVASKDGLAWLNLVQADLEGTGYAVGAVDTCAAGFGAPHIRQRLYWVGHSVRAGLEGHGRRHSVEGGRLRTVRPATSSGESDWLGNAKSIRRQYVADVYGGGGARDQSPKQRSKSGVALSVSGVAHAESDRRREGQSQPGGCASGDGAEGAIRRAAQFGVTSGMGNAASQRYDRGGADSSEQPAEMSGARHEVAGGQPATSPTNGFWRTADWLFCRDNKWRSVVAKPQPLVDGSARSLGRVRDEFAENLKEKINAWSVENKINGTQGLRDLLITYGEKAASEWPTGGIPGLCEAPFLLSFLRQLEEQGWRKPERLPVSCEEVGEAVMRSMWVKDGIAGASRQHGLEGQSAREYSDALSVLSSLLAWGAREAWGVAYDAYAETQHPLTKGAANRVGRLRGYGNAIVAPVAEAFVRAYLDEFEG